MIPWYSQNFYKDSTTFWKDSKRIPKGFRKVLQGFQKILRGIHMIPWYSQNFSLEVEYKDSSRFHGIPQDSTIIQRILHYSTEFPREISYNHKKMDSNSPRGRHLKHNNLPIILLPTIFFKEFFLEDILSRNILSLLYSLKTGE